MSCACFRLEHSTRLHSMQGNAPSSSRNSSISSIKVSRKAVTKYTTFSFAGEPIGRTEATGAFFAITKLWQSKDPTLRRLVYLAIKELSVLADDVIIVTSSLTKDMTGREDVYRASAIRALCKITDTAMLQTIERYMKQAIVDKNGAVASAALVSSLHLMKKSVEVRRKGTMT